MHYRIASATALALILSGCATPRHSNLLIFGTNTVVGLKVGADATQTPAIQLAYSRQELVLMPLLANTSGSGDQLAPCPAQEAAVPDDPPTPAQLSINCKFVGTDKDQIDSYSVLASFGARFDATSNITEPKTGQVKAGGGIAQYFATGLAARELAKHGSSLVAVGEAATAEAKASNPEGQKWISERHAKFQLIADHLEKSAVADGPTLDKAMQNLDTSVLSTPTFVSLCSSASGVTKQQCVGLIRKYDTSLIQGLSNTQLDAAVLFSF